MNDDEVTKDNEPYPVKSWWLWSLLYAIPYWVIGMMIFSALHELIEDYPAIKVGSILALFMGWVVAKLLSRKRKYWRIGWITLIVFYVVLAVCVILD